MISNIIPLYFLINLFLCTSLLDMTKKTVLKKNNPNVNILGPLLFLPCLLFILSFLFSQYHLKSSTSPKTLWWMKAPTSPSCAKPMGNRSLQSAGNSSPPLVSPLHSLCLSSRVTLMLPPIKCHIFSYLIFHRIMCRDSRSLFTASFLTLCDPWSISRFNYYPSLPFPGSSLQHNCLQGSKLTLLLLTN